jgi:Zn-dependent M28 family amino/carboxypeptidase
MKANVNAGFLMANVSVEVAGALLGNATPSLATLKEVKKGNYTTDATIAATKTTENLESSNVIAVLPGTDKKEEYLMLTGHYDHLGKRGDVIYYGADDDGSGTVSVMQMAEAFSAAAKKGFQPRRTIVFMTVSGEEKGLWGSEYYGDHPIFPLDKTTADLNTDMVGRVDTERQLGDTLNYVYVIGHDKLSTDLPVINEAANKASSNITLDYKYDDPNDKNNIYYRSDHYNFAKKGVPILFFYDGMLLADYHKPTDTIEKINFDLMQKRVLMVYYTACEIAQREDMLKRDLKLNMPGR